MFKWICFTCYFLIYANHIFSQQIKHSQFDITDKLIVLTSTGKENNHLPVFKVLDHSDSEYIAVKKIFSESSISYSIILYDYVQQFLQNKQLQKKKEPAYLALTNNEGCFGLIGFYILSEGKLIDQSKSGYIDLNKNMILSNIDQLESITQIFPHEMGHVIQNLLCGEIPENELPGAIDVHYFSITTDYRTAFSEGFAEHMENISRDNEENKSIKMGIEEDSRIFSNALDCYSAPFTRDFTFPLRLGFFRSSIALKYQQFESYKRFMWAKKNYSKYKNSTSGRVGSDNYILFRNTGISIDTTHCKNISQAESNEGVISSFFYNLVNADCKNKFMDSSIYKLFLSPDSCKMGINSIIPQTNEYLKIFYVLNKYVRSNHFGSSLLHLFIKGYIQEFPNEKPTVLNIYKLSTGNSFNEKEIPELWLISPKFKHSFWVMAQYGLKSPFYIFDLNAADAGDLMTLEEITKKEADRIIHYRDSIIFFKSITDIKEIHELSENTIRTVLDAKLTKMPDSHLPEKSFKMLLLYPLLNLSKNIVIWYALFIGIFYFLYYKKHKRQISLWKLFLAKFINFLILSIIALICVVLFKNPIPYFIFIFVLILLLKYLINRKNISRRNEVLLAFSIMGIIIVYSLL